MSTAEESNAKSRLGFKCTSVSCAEDEFPSTNFLIKLFCALPLSTAGSDTDVYFPKVNELIFKPFLKCFSMLIFDEI